VENQREIQRMLQIFKDIDNMFRYVETKAEVFSYKKVVVGRLEVEL
jgi:hypothetical protein